MDGTTGIVVAVLGAVTAIVISILKYSNERNEKTIENKVKQTELSVNLVNIEKELVEIKALLVKNCDSYVLLEKRVSQIETNCRLANKNIDME